MRTRRNSRIATKRINPLVLVGILVALVAIVAVPVFSIRSEASAGKTLKTLQAQPVRTAANALTGSSLLATSLSPIGPTVTTYEYSGGSCTNTPKSSFNLGETVCATITGAAQTVDGRPTVRLGWVSPYGSLTQGANITTDPQTGTYDIPATALQTLTDSGVPPGSVVVDNRGVWSIGLYSTADGSFLQDAKFTVHDPTKEFVDLSLHQSTSLSESQVGAGSGSVFKLFLTNKGPDAAHDVVLSDTVPANTTFSSMIENTGLGFSCGTPSGGVFTCTLASMPAGATAEFTFAYDVDSGAPAGATITNTATATSSDTPCAPSTPCEIQPNDNSSSIDTTVPAAAGNETCTLVCHENFSVVANTTQGGNPGAFVSFGSASVFGNCGAITASPASGTFFQVGTTVVNVSSDTGGGNCSFTISVVEGTPPTISCPSDKNATADSGGTHTFTVPEIGSPTTNPTTGVVVTFERSDDIPATYDANGDIVTPAVVHSLTDPFSIGTTGITWTVTDSNGLAASCTQRVVVHEPCATDTAPPTITAPADINASTGPNSTTCGVVLDDTLFQPTVTDDCSASFTVSGMPAGHLFPVGTTTLIYTATDGAGHTATATQHVTVTDNTPPVIYAPANASYTCPEQVPTLSPAQAFGPDLSTGTPDPTKPVFDNCGSPAVTASQSTSGVGSGANPLVITRIYTALDSHGNSASAVQVITVTDTTPPTITAPADVVAYTGPSATTCDTVVSLGTASAHDNCAGVTVSRSPSGNTFPVGTTTVTWTATDWAGNMATATQTVTVIDNTPPTITLNGSTPSMWPPNHRYQTFAVTNFVTSVFDNCGGVTVGDVRIDHVSSDETENGNGDGNTSNDILISGDCQSVQLRAERDGGGDGRVYTIYFRLTDTHGNTTTVTAKVVVPHNPGETPVDSGPHYTVNGTCP